MRPGGLSNFPGGISEIVFQQGDARGAQGLITREDVALVSIETLTNEGAKNKTFEVINGDINPEDDWPNRFAELAQDETSGADDSGATGGIEVPRDIRSRIPTEQE